MNESAKVLKYWPALDGLRGIAVLAVVIFHAGATWLQGGFLGVDVFFVLSGFLITSQLLIEQRQFGDISIKSFFIRRVVRLQPALWILFAGYLSLWSIGWVPVTGPSALKEIFVAGAGLANWARAFEIWMPDYLGHTWSLAIEEQFYLIWAIFLSVWWGTRVDVSQATFRVSLAFSALSLVTMYIVFNSGATASRAYNGLDTRAFALLFGSALACHWIHGNIGNRELSRKKPNWVLCGLLLSPLMAIFGLFYFARWLAPIMYPWGYLLTAGLTAAVIWRVVSADQSPVRSLLEARWLVQLGKVSYGYYLWHYPILRIAAHKAADFGVSPIASQIWGLILSFLLALVSYYLVEQPLRTAYKRSRGLKSV